ncbi:MAG: hypothetical protein JRF24_06955 [Deltaproteobacteria bacterium]|nr:hypothetical protein [Deltaproteobacteria bacterium]
MKVTKIKSYVKQLQLKHYIGLAGICLAILGWGLANTERCPAIYRIVTPSYAASVSALQKMGARDFILEKGDEGFEEIAAIMKGFFEATLNRQISYIKTLNRGVDVSEESSRAEWNSYLELEVAFPGEPAFTGKFYDLESKVEEAYLESKLLTWRDAIFGAGILVIVVALFM